MKKLKNKIKIITLTQKLMLVMKMVIKKSTSYVSSMILIKELNFGDLIVLINLSNGSLIYIINIKMMKIILITFGVLTVESSIIYS